jgi:hypothetical protein
MPHLSSTDRLLTVAIAMATAMQHPHPEVPFAQVGDDTIKALHNWQPFSKRSLKNQKRQN